MNNNGIPVMFDPIHLTHSLNESGEHIYDIIDGQHRYKALFDIHQTEHYMNFDVYIAVHEIETEEDKMVLLDIINERKPIRREDIIQYKIPMFLDALKKYFYGREGQGSKYIIYGKNRPRLDKDELTRRLNTVSMRERMAKYSVDDLLRFFLNENRNISRMPRGIQCGSGKTTKSILDKAVQNDFYLGLDKNMVWLNNLV